MRTYAEQRQHEHDSRKAWLQELIASGMYGTDLARVSQMQVGTLYRMCKRYGVDIKKHKFGGRTKAPEPEPPKVTVRKSVEHAKAYKAAAARQRKIAAMVAKGYPKHVAEQQAGMNG
jgi:hypothetical protein